MVFRCFVEKKPGFDGAARALCRELTEQLGVRGLERVRVLNRYDVEGVDAAVYAAARWSYCPGSASTAVRAWGPSTGGMVSSQIAST